MEKNVFPLGFWNYARLNGMGEDPVKDWVEAGMNLCHSPRFVPGEDDPAAMVALLDECERNGVSIDVIDCDHDLGDFETDGGDGIKLIEWLAAGMRFYPVALHTMNPVGRANMQSVIDRYWK